MQNHVHVMFRPQNPHTLDSILHSWKSYTSNQANRILARRGTFWMAEYYDHLIRDQADFRTSTAIYFGQSNESGPRFMALGGVFG